MTLSRVKTIQDRDEIRRREEADAPRGTEPKRSIRWQPIATFFSIWLGGSWLVVGGWLQPLLPGGWGAVAVGLAVLAIPMWVLICGFAGRSYPSAAMRLLVLRPFWYAVLFMPQLAIVTLIGGMMGLPAGAMGTAGRWALAGGAALVVIASLVGWVGSRRLVVKRLAAHMPRLPPAFDGVRVVQISDLHVGPHTSRGILARVAKTVEAETPDLICITGDQVDDFAHDVKYFNDAFSDLRAPLGVFAVAGNHDVYAGWDAVYRGLWEAGFLVLVNGAVPAERSGQRLWIAGTGDPAGKGWSRGGGRGAAPDVEHTLADIPADEPVLALAHNPALWPALAERGVDLTLSGHTHYGQFAVPSRGWSMASVFLKYAMGWHVKGRSLLYINPGTNFWGIPFRIGTFPEVTVLTLKASRDGAARITELPESGVDLASSRGRA